MPMPLLAATLCLVLPQSPAPAELRRELARLVDLPTAAARQQAADDLARKRAAPIAQWLEACAAFGEFEALEPGPSRHDVDLHVLGQIERTELHLFVPKGYDPARPAPLLLWGHGAGGTGAREYLHWETVASAIGLLVLAPTEFGKEPGWGFSARERAAQLAALRWARRRANVDENAVFVGGASRGGHMTWDLILRSPDPFAGAVPCIGGPRLQIGANNNLRYLENAAHLPIRDLQGSQDDPLLLQNLRLAFARLPKLGARDAVLHELAGRGHDFDLGVVDWTAFFARRRAPARERVVRLATEAAEARAAWIEITALDARIDGRLAPQVDPRAMERLDEAGQRALVHDKLVEMTARLAVEHRGGGRFVAEARGVRSFALLLAPAMLGKDGAVEVRWQNRTTKAKAAPSVAVLLREFAERFDRTFLPVARVAVP